MMAMGDVIIPAPSDMAFEDDGVTGRLYGSPLTYREIAVIEAKALGLSNKEVADRLKISDQTVKNYVSFALAKTNAPNSLALCVRYAVWKATGGNPYDPPTGLVDRISRLEDNVRELNDLHHIHPEQDP